MAPCVLPIAAEPNHCVGAVIIAYNPSPTLYENVLALADQVSRILIVDNASNSESRTVLERLRGLPRTDIIQNSSNLGIGAALNVGARWAIERGYGWIATFDQDSRVGPGFVAEMLHAYSEHPQRGLIGLVAPRYREQTTGLALDGVSAMSGDEIVLTSMMSGNLVRTDVLKTVGFYNEQFFIDYVDHELCLRMARYGFRVLKSAHAVLQHNLGRLSLTKVGNRILATTNHSPLRRYYNARNRIFVYRLYGRFVPWWVVHDMKYFLIDTVKIPFLEPEGRAKLSSIVRGIWHGLAGKYGAPEG
jgi:rhamnosyltransferase